MKEILEKVKKIVAGADAEIQDAVQPLFEKGNDKIIKSIKTLLRQIHGPVKDFMVSLDSDWTEPEKAQMIQDYRDGKRDPLSGKTTKEPEKKKAVLKKKKE